MSTTRILPATSLVRNADIVTAPLDDEMIMLNVETGSYYALDPVGRRIWDLLERPTTFADLCTTLKAEYDVDDETCEREVSSVVREMVDEQLVHLDMA